MTDMEIIYRFLLKSQTNELFDMIQNSGYSPEDFTWEHYADNYRSDVVRLIHTPSKAYFAIVFSEADKLSLCGYSPAFLKVKTTQPVKEWPALIPEFSQWLNCLRRELESPDLWSELSQDKRFISAASEEEANNAFTKEERDQIAINLNEIKEYVIKTLSPDAAHITEIEAKIDYLIEASDRVGRKDWKIIVVSILMSFAVEHPDKARDLFRFAGNVFQWLYHQSTKLLS